MFLAVNSEKIDEICCFQSKGKENESYNDSPK